MTLFYGAEAREMADDITLEFRKSGIGVLGNYLSEDMQKRILFEVPTAMIDTIPLNLKAAMSNSDAIISIDSHYFANLSLVPRRKIEKLANAQDATQSILTNKAIKWLGIAYPGRSMARAMRISPRFLSGIFFRASLTQPSTLRKLCRHVIRRLRSAKEMRVTDDLGTNLTLDVRGRELVADDGIIDSDNVKRGHLGGNLPAGEAYVCPKPKTAHGIFVSPTVKDPLHGVFVSGAKLFFEEGGLVMNKSTATHRGDQLWETIRKHMEIDRKRYGDQTALELAEFAIGLNPGVDRTISYTMIDEKALGTSHIAIGRNIEHGGLNESSIHLDFVSGPGTRIFFDDQELDLSAETVGLI